MSAPRKNTRVTERRVEVARRYLQGEHQATIARDLGVSQCLISKDLAAIRQGWRESAIRDFDALKAEQLAKIDAVEVASWASFTCSKDDSESTIAERSNGREKVSRRVEKSVGDPRWLQTILTCVERRCQLLGLNAPARYKIDFDALTDTQMERLARGEPVAAVLAEQHDSRPLAEA